MDRQRLDGRIPKANVLRRIDSRSRWIILIGVLAVSWPNLGCAMRNVASFTDQRTAILEVIPLGTPRGEAAVLLKEAGISYSTSGGPEPGVYYCESWEMEPGDRFHLFSELLFDEEGRLQDVREIPNNFAP
ncbi:hypothetical protein CA54_52350 [Symmachiella macrocystis]|uniref:Uncharacterized protein n=1 Tax=Symmachiella macrocystis TaxID=2527985 RepID=A0A5C6B3G5_9PLAN|nr:hypothetical protein [Symmachiella macrocystis]TWU06835.1 hypothetical protein CA54_52350 [Symmachiella macrocystis]